MANFDLSKPLFQSAMPDRPTHNYAARGRQGMVLRHDQFLNDMGTPTITVNNAGWYIGADGKPHSYPVFVACDLLSADAGGLMPTSGLIYDASELLTRFLVRNERLLVVVNDAHVDNRHVNQDALTQLCITIDLYLQLTAEEQRRVDRYFVAKAELPSKAERDQQIRSGATSRDAKARLTAARWQRYMKQGIDFPDYHQEAQDLRVHEVEMIFGESPDGEFRSFLFNFPHCIEPLETGSKGLTKWVPYMQDVFMQMMRAAAAARENGETAPNMRVISVHKNDLRPNVGNGERGTGGNYFDEIIYASQWGLAQGTAHDDERKAVVYGMGTPFTAGFAIRNLLAQGIRVRLQMDSTYNFDPTGISMLETVRQLRHEYPEAFEAVIGWDEEWMGDPQPVARNGMTYNQLAQEIVFGPTGLYAHMQSTAGADLNMDFYPFTRDGSETLPVVLNFIK